MEPWQLKKKLTDNEKFSFRLCLALGAKHPRYLLSCLLWEEFCEWKNYADQEPFGEERADQRTQALAAWMKLPRNVEWGGEVPELIYPYWHTVDDFLREKATLDKMASEARAKIKPQRERETLAGG